MKKTKQGNHHRNLERLICYYFNRFVEFCMLILQFYCLCCAIIVSIVIIFLFA